MVREQTALYEESMTIECDFGYSMEALDASGQDLAYLPHSAGESGVRAARVLNQ
jgi:hypothetical protein